MTNETDNHMIRIALITLSLSSVSAATLAQGNSSLVQAGMELISAYTLNDAQVASVAKQAVQQMDAKYPVAAPNDPYTLRLNRIVARHQKVGNLPINYKVYKTADVNAFATADGSVRVFKGLMDLMSDNEVLAVIGHEIGHVANRDSRDAMKAALKRSAIRNVGASQSGVIGQLSRSQLAGMTDYIVGASFSRKQETEADDYSYAFLKRNGYSVMPLASSFEKLAQQGGSGGPAFLSTHPDSKARAKRIRDRARSEGIAR